MDSGQKADNLAGNQGTGGDGTPPASDAAAKQSAESVINRRSRWASSLAALRYVTSVSLDNEVKTRDSDRATAIALLVICAGALIALVMPQAESHRVAFALAADVVVGFAVLMYVANRFGIVTTFHPRQALLTWQLMLGSALLGIFLTINLALIIAELIRANRIIVPM
jgi:RsiW-degrading membrane proteinase PrsW (M82 family)